MANYQNHVIDPTFFWDAIQMIGEFEYDVYVFVEHDKDEDYKVTKTYNKTTIKGSLQSQGNKVIKEVTGNKTEHIYEFYCRSLYRINNGDFIEYKGKLLLVYETHDFDEYGVRWAALKEVNLYEYQDLQDYMAYLEGEKFV